MYLTLLTQDDSLTAHGQLLQSIRLGIQLRPTPQPEPRNPFEIKHLDVASELQERMINSQKAQVSGRIVWGCFLHCNLLSIQAWITYAHTALTANKFLWLCCGAKKFIYRFLWIHVFYFACFSPKICSWRKLPKNWTVIARPPWKSESNSIVCEELLLTFTILPLWWSVSKRFLALVRYTVNQRGRENGREGERLERISGEERRRK